MLLKKTLLCLIATTCVVFMSCTGIPDQLPDDITSGELIRKAQESYDKGKYKAAEYYYNAAISRSLDNPRELLFSEYELAHMKIKQKKFDEGKVILNRLLSYYNGNEDSSVYPPAYKKLIELDLSKIPEPETKDSNNPEK